MKIFFHSGTQEFEFSRLLDFAISYSKKNVNFLVTYQGYLRKNNFINRDKTNIEIVRFINKKKFEKLIFESDVVVCHSGTGAIFNSINLGHKPYVLPRLTKFNEHNDNHQLELYNFLLAENLILSLPCEEVLKSTKDSSCKTLGRKIFNGKLKKVLINEIEAICKQ